MIPNRLMQLFGNLPTFGGNFNPAVQQQQIQVPEQEDEYHPQTRMYDELSNLIANQPQRGKVGLGSKLLGIMAGVGSNDPYGTADKIANRDYYRNLGEWSNKVKNYQAGANLENDINQNERIFQYNKLQDSARNRQIQRQEDRDDELKRAALEREDIARQDQQRKDKDAETRRKTLDLKELIANKPSWEGKIDKDGYVVYIDKNDPSKTPIKTDIDTTDMTPYQLEVAKSQLRINEINARGEQARETKQVASPTKAATIKEPSASQKARELFDKVMAIRNQNPDLAGFITLGPSNTFKLKPPSFANMRPEAKAKYDKLVTDVYGDNPPAEFKSNSTTTQPKEGDVKIFPNGKKGRWDGKGWVLVSE